MPKVVIFDIVRTLIDRNASRTATWVDADRHSGIDAAEIKVRSQMKRIGDQPMPILSSPDLLHERGREISAFRSELLRRDDPSRTQALPEMRSVFARIKTAGRMVVLASSGKDVSPFDPQAAMVGLVTVGLLCGGFAQKALRAAGCTASSETRLTFAAATTPRA